jgi:hypothetical protein
LRSIVRSGAFGRDSCIFPTAHPWTFSPPLVTPAHSRTHGTKDPPNAVSLLPQGWSASIDALSALRRLSSRQTGLGPDTTSTWIRPSSLSHLLALCSTATASSIRTSTSTSTSANCGGNSAGSRAADAWATRLGKKGRGNLAKQNSEESVGSVATIIP